VVVESCRFCCSCLTADLLQSISLATVGRSECKSILAVTGEAREVMVWATSKMECGFKLATYAMCTFVRVFVVERDFEVYVKAAGRSNAISGLEGDGATILDRCVGDHRLFKVMALHMVLCLAASSGRVFAASFKSLTMATKFVIVQVDDDTADLQRTTFFMAFFDSTAGQ